MQNLACLHGDLMDDALWNSQPVQADQRMSYIRMFDTIFAAAVLVELVAR